MGNQQLVRILSDIGITDISNREVCFQDGLLQAKAIFQRHNYQLYQVYCPQPGNPMGFDTSTNLTLRVIRCLNDQESIQILKEMQARVINLKQHPNLVRIYVMAVVAENHSQKQKAGLIGLPGLYKSVAGTTDYKTDTLQFLVVEEDHLTQLPSTFFGSNHPPPAIGEKLPLSKFTLKQFLDRILPNQLLIELFRGDETLMCQLIVQSLQALAFINEQQINHQDLSPQSIILELIPSAVNDGNFKELGSLTADDFHQKFKVKLGEFLNIKMLSDIAFQKTMLLQTQARLAQERIYLPNSDAQPDIKQIIQQIRENKQLYSQYDPPEKLEMSSIEYVAKSKNSRNLEDFDISVRALKLQNMNSDIWSLAIVILELYLSLFVCKKDCREMVHNLYLNKLSYQSRCSIINEMLDAKKNPILCQLLQEMLRDSNPSESPARPTAAQLLSKNRIIHYFAYISDNEIEDKYLPNDINLLQVFSSNEMFVPMLIQCGMQNILNKSKAVICFFTLMTLYIKSNNEEIVTSLIASKAYIQIIELLNFCMNSDLKAVMHFFNQNLVNNNIENLEINDQLFTTDFNEQKQAGLEILTRIIQMHNFHGASSNNAGASLFSILSDYTQAGIIPLIILLIQRIKNQKWFRMKDLSLLTHEESFDPMTLSTLDLIELFAKFSPTKTLGVFVDKIDFYNQLCEIIVQSYSQSKSRLVENNKSTAPTGKSFIEGQKNDKLRNRRFSQKRPTMGDDQILENSAQDNEIKFRNHGSNSQANIYADTRTENSDNSEQRQKTDFRERMLDFVITNCGNISEANLKKILEVLGQSSQQLKFLSSPQMKSVAKSCSVDFKKHVADFLMKRFLILHLKTDKSNFGNLQSVGPKPEMVSARGGAEIPFSPNQRIRENRKSSKQLEVNQSQAHCHQRSQNRGYMTPAAGAGGQTQKRAQKSDSETQMLQISTILTYFIDIQGHLSQLKHLQSCISDQVCLSSLAEQLDDSQIVPQDSMDNSENLKANMFSQLDFSSQNPNGAQRRPGTTFSPRMSTQLDLDKRPDSQAPQHGASNLAYFFHCGQCSQHFCIVCALKFHQDHKEIRPCAISKSQKLKCSSINQEVPNYLNQNFEWRYGFEARIKQSELAMAELRAGSQKVSQSFLGNTAAQRSTKRDFKQQLQLSNELQALQGQDALLDSSTSKNEAHPALLNLDLFDSDSIFTECNDTHFISNDFEQHSFISKYPLEFNSQAYFEIKIHSGGYYDQMQIGLIFLLEDDIRLGLNSSSDLLNTLKNNSVIPGYEPLSIGYHGDDGRMYYNLSSNVCLETLIHRAKEDSEQLVKDAENDGTLFDISNQLVYGGMYGPTYSSGDQVGCGIVPVSSDPDQCAIYFTRNGIKLPAIKVRSQGIKFFPIVSMKGKLCHFQLIKNLKEYGLNRLILQEFQHNKFVTSIRLNDKFTRSLNQFVQIQSLKQTKRLPPDQERSKTRGERSESKRGVRNAPAENLVKLLKDEEQTQNSSKQSQNFKIYQKTQRNTKTSMEKSKGEKTNNNMSQMSLGAPNAGATGVSTYRKSLQNVQNVSKLFQNKRGQQQQPSTQTANQTRGHIRNHSKNVVKNFVQENRIKTSKSSTKL